MRSTPGEALDLFPTPPIPDRKIVVGTSGYSFPDWVGSFYPAGTKAAQLLPYYAQHFPAVEVNVSYYRMPEPRMLERMARQTPEGFRFVVKLNREMTHEASLDRAKYHEFRAALRPLKDAGKYDALLAQFPWAFDDTPEHRAWLASMRERLGEEPVFTEFRHASWASPDLESFLKAHHLGYCAVDEPRLEGLMPPIVLRSTEDAYIRFHGRNAKTWWARSEPGDRTQLRYDYEYKPQELQEWVRRVAELAEQARRTYLFFNNCHAGQAARSAKLMQELLRQQNLPA